MSSSLIAYRHCVWLIVAVLPVHHNSESADTHIMHILLFTWLDLYPPPLPSVWHLDYSTWGKQTQQQTMLVLITYPSQLKLNIQQNSTSRMGIASVCDLNLKGEGIIIWWMGSCKKVHRERCYCQWSWVLAYTGKNWISPSYIFDVLFLFITFTVQCGAASPV